MKFSKIGFTFLEVIIAISVLIIGVLATLQVFPLALNIEKLNQMETQAIFLAQEKIEERISRAYQNIQIITETEDPLSFPYERFSRETKVTYVDSDLATTSLDLGFKKIEVTVRWRSSLRIREKSVNLITLIAEK